MLVRGRKARWRNEGTRLHRATTDRTQVGRGRGNWFCGWRMVIKIFCENGKSGSPVFQLLPERGDHFSQGGAEEAIITDLDEAFGQNMLQEAMNEIFSTQRARSFHSGLRVPITKRDLVVFQLQDAVIANGHSEDVGCKILQGSQARSHFFTMHDPLLLPHFGRDPRITIRVT